MNIAICDDNPYWLQQAETHLRDWAQRRAIDIAYSSFLTTAQLLDHLSTSDEAHLILLDLDFSGRADEGMIVAENIRKMGNRIPVLFLTANPSMVHDSFLVDALGYLDKPIDADRLARYLDHLLERIQSQRILRIQAGSQLACIAYDDLCYIEAMDHTVNIYTRQGEYSVRKPFVELLQLIGEQDFVQIHRSFAVSRNKITELRTAPPYKLKLAVGRDKVELDVTRKYIEHVLQVYSSGLLERVL